MQRAGSSLGTFGEKVAEIFDAATKTAADPRASEKIRVQAVQLLALTSYAKSSALLLSLLNLEQPQPIQLAAISTLARFPDPQVGPEIIKRWNTFTPHLRSEALAALLARVDRSSALLQAISEGSISAAALDTTQTKFLSNHRDKTVRDLAAKMLSTQPVGSRQQIIDTFMPALRSQRRSGSWQKDLSGTLHFLSSPRP